MQTAPETSEVSAADPEEALPSPAASHPQKEKYGELTRIRPVRTWMSILGDVLSIAVLLMLTFHFPEPWLIILSGILIARQQYALGVLGHDGAHSRLFKNRKFNHLMGRILFNGATMISYDGYRRTHLRHHYHLMTDEDPDKKFIEHFPVPLRKFLPQCLPDFIGLTWLYLFLYYGWHGFKEQKRRLFFTAATLLPGVIFNSVIFTVYWWLDNPWLYVYCWLLPMLTILPIYMHIRGICEHAMLGTSEGGGNQMLSTRTVINPIQTYFFAPHNLNYHMEHHAYPGIPQYNLPALHQKLKEKRQLPLENLYRSYLPILKLLIRGKTESTDTADRTP